MLEDNPFPGSMKEDGFNRLSGLAWPELARAADLVSPWWGFAHEVFYKESQRRRVESPGRRR